MIDDDELIRLSRVGTEVVGGRTPVHKVLIPLIQRTTALSQALAAANLEIKRLSDLKEPRHRNANELFKLAISQEKYAEARKLVELHDADIKTLNLANWFRVATMPISNYMDPSLEFLIRARNVTAPLLTQIEKDDALKVMAERGCFSAVNIMLEFDAKATHVDLVKVYQKRIGDFKLPDGSRYLQGAICTLIKAGAKRGDLLRELSTAESLGSYQAISYQACVELRGIVSNAPGIPTSYDKYEAAMAQGRFKIAGDWLSKMDPLEFEIFENPKKITVSRDQILGNYQEFLEFLNVHAQSPWVSKDTLFYVTIEYDCHEASMILLKHDASAKHVDLYNVLTNIKCSLEETYALVDALLKAGAQVKVAALELASAREYNAIVTLLLSYYKDKNHALAEAVGSGFLHAAKQLIAAGANIDSLQLVPVLEKLLSSANKTMDPAILDHLIKSATPANKKRAIEIAITLGYEEAVTKLLQAGMSVYDRTISGGTLLALAVQGPNQSIVEYLIRERADLNACSHFEFSDRDWHRESVDHASPLLIAYCYEKHATARLLLAKGADLNVLIKTQTRSMVEFKGIALEYFKTNPARQSGTFFEMMCKRMTPWVEQDKIMRDETASPKKRTLDVLAHFIALHSPKSSFSFISAAPTLPSAVVKAMNIKRMVSEMQDGPAFCENLVKKLPECEAQHLKPGQMDNDEQDLAAICQRLTVYFNAEVGIKKIAEIEINDTYDPKGKGSGNKMIELKKI